MRDLLNLLDNLSEATIRKYGPGSKFTISSSQQGQKVADLLQQQGVNTEGPMEYLNWADVDQNNISAVIGKPGLAGDKSYMAFKNSIDQVWVYNAGESTINSSFTHFHGGEGDDVGKIANRGEVSEGILGAAMFAKFTKREGREEVGMVTVQDVVGVLDTLKNVGEDTYQVTVKDSDNKHADTVIFRLVLKTNPYQDLMNPAKREMLAKEFASAVAYVNSPMADRYSKYFYLNGKADEINIIADGAASETSSKVDVWVAIRDEDGNLRRLKLNASLKVGGVAQFGQVGGSEFETMEKLWSYFGINVAPYEKTFRSKGKKDQFEALTYMYKSVATALAKQLKGDDDSAEARFVDNVAHAVTYFATLGDSNVELVDFDKGGYTILRFNNLKEKMRDVNLTASYLSNKSRPEISIHDIDNPKKELVNIRCKIENRPNSIYVRNIIEKGKLLEEITKVQRRAWHELTTPDPEQTRVAIRPVGAKRATAKVKEPGLGRKRR